ncbi:MAG: ABC transporter ATP-binding protein [Burkholderiales bacterium]|nr:ABC transporter ATP-binding protein [Burkholderiales bacterium]
MNENYIIDVSNLDKTFGEHKVVDNLTLKVAQGEIFGFLGPNGSGKTTSIRMLCGLLTPDSGSGSCLGYDILKQSEAIKCQTGYMTQAFSMWTDLTVWENLDFVAHMYMIKNRKKSIKDILTQFNLSSKANQLAGSLSGGWKQRLALASCMLHQPKLLLLDEPTAGVDPKARRDFWEDLHSLASQGITVLVSTHYMDEAERCHKLAYVYNGKLITYGTVNEIIQQNMVYTYAIDGDNLTELANNLKVENGVEQTILFGNTLHVSGSRQRELALVLDKLPQQYKIRQITTSLEDVFVYLMNKK